MTLRRKKRSELICQGDKLESLSCLHIKVAIQDRELNLEKIEKRVREYEVKLKLT